MNFGLLSGVLEVLKQGTKLYHQVKERDQANIKRVYETGSEHNTRYFIRDGVDFE